VGKPEGKIPHLKPRLRWKDNINMDFLQNMMGEWTGFIRLRRGTGTGSCECGSEPPGSIKCGGIS
jgi:hypothetical protein